MASSSQAPQPRDKYHAFSGIEPGGIRRKVSESTEVYDVFINHRGPDSKLTLALPFYKSLNELGIQAFLDLEEMELGLSFPSKIETAIRSAAVHIAIFSKRYAESPWCLAELDLMLQSPAKIIPVFYDVEPWELRHIDNGVYAAAFIQYEQKSRYLDKLKQWKEALQSVSFTTGYEIKDSIIGDRQSILSAVQKEVERIRALVVARYPVALDKLVQDFERRCLYKLVQAFEIFCGMNKEEERKTKMVGIFGMGGVGKTTLAKELFNRKRPQYARACFLFDVREASTKSNLSSLQSKILKDLFNKDGLSFQSTEEGSSCISNHIERSTSLNFLIVLDDIDHLEQLDALSIASMREKPGNSLVIITTRDVGILVSEEINTGYHVKGMDKGDARQLFCWHAFSQPHPASGYEDLVDNFIGVCGGLPLSLRVLGRHVHGRVQSYWSSELQKLGTTMHPDIKKKLKISFDALGAEEKQIFMDMACFFVDQLKYIAIRVWKASGWRAQNGLQTLKDKCLVEEIEDQVPVLRMHDHLRDLGREMANELNQPHRLWRPQDHKDLESKGFENILAQTKGRCFRSIFFKSLNFEVKFFIAESDGSGGISPRLIWLHLWYPYIYSGPYSSNLNHMIFSVQPTIPPWIPLQNIQCLRINNGYFQRLWQQDAEFQAPSELKELEISRTFLEEYPECLGILTDKEQEVEKKAKEVQHTSTPKSSLLKTWRRLPGSLPTNSARKPSTFKTPLNGRQESTIVKAPLSLLEDLIIKEQENITKIVLNGYYCPSLQSMELSSLRNLTEVQFRGVETLNCLNISKCKYLKLLSVTSKLTQLEELSISDCPILEEPNLGHLRCLKKMKMAYCNMNRVPGMPSFEMLVELNVTRCPNLHELCLTHLSCLERVIIKDCHQLLSVTGLSYLIKLVEVSISWCWVLQLDLCLVGLNSLKNIEVDMFVKVKCCELIGCKKLETVSGISFEMIRVVKICDCPELKDFPVVRGSGYLELITINGCRKLNHLKLIDCEVLKRVSGNFDVDELSISDCPMLQELPSFGHVMYLEQIRILRCLSLESITLPVTLKRLDLNSCKELKTMMGISALKKITEVNIKKCPQLRLQLNCSTFTHLKSISIVECGNVYNITVPTTLTELTVQRCMKLKFNGGIGHVTELKEMHISECPEIEEMPVVRGLNCLETIIIDGCAKFNYLHVIDCAILKVVRGNFDLGHLAQLWIWDCPELEELPCFAHSSCLEEIRIFRCGRLQKLTLTRTLKILQLDSCIELKSLSEISHLTNLVELSISQCALLELDLRLEAIGSLQSIIFDGCGKLQSLLLSRCQNLKRVLGNYDAEWISVCGCDELEEVWISDCPGLSCLEKIFIESCAKLQSIALPAKLTNLVVHRCKRLQRIGGMDELSKLTELDISECPEVEFLNLAELSCLKSTAINSSDKLHKVILPASLLKISVQCCRTLQIIAGIDNHSMLTEIYISKCPDLEELPVLFGPMSVESVAIDGCEKLHSLHVADCAIPGGVLSSIDPDRLAQLSISDCPALEGLPCFARLTRLERISIVSCMKLQKITLPVLLKHLHLDSCKELKRLSEMGDLSMLTELSVSECPEIEELPIHSRQSSLKRIIVYSCDKLHKISLPTTLKILTLQRCRNLREVAAMGDLSELTRLHISKCPDLEELPVPFGRSSLESIKIDGCRKLYRLKVADCGILDRVSRSFDLGHFVQLWISDCPALEDLSCFARLTCVEEIRISRCGKLAKIGLPVTLKSLHLDSCRELHCVSEMGCLPKLTDLRVSECPGIQELPILAGICCLKRIVIYSCQKLHKIALPATLVKLTVQWCRNLQRVAALGDLTKLTELHISNCPELVQLTFFSNLRSLEKITIDVCEKLHRLQLADYAISKEDFDLAHLAQLWISNCSALEELPCFSRLRCLKGIHIFRCRKLKKITLPLSLTDLQLESCTELKRVSGLSHHKNLADLILSDCGQLEVELRLEDMDSLQSVTFDGYGKQKSLLLNNCQNLKRLSGNYHVELLSIRACPELQELPNLAGSSSLEGINIDSCDNLRIVTLPSSLIQLTVRRCIELQTIAATGSLAKLTFLYISDCEELEVLPDLPGVSYLIIDSCQKLHNVPLPTTLKKLTVQRCRNLQTAAGIGHLAMLAEMYITECPKIELPFIFGLSHLESVTMDGYRKFNYLQVIACPILKVIRFNFDAGHLTQLWISDCPTLEELPCFAHLTCLEEIHIFKCIKLQKVTFPTTLRNLHLDSCKELRTVSEISSLTNLMELIISECEQLELDLTLENMDSLHSITLDGCGKIKSFRLNKCKNLRTVLGSFDVDWISICDCHELEVLSMRDCPGPSCLKKIDIETCDKLHSLTLPTTLIELKVQLCRGLQTMAGIHNLTKLPILAGLNCLETIVIDSCEKLHSVLLPPALLKLTVHRCRGLKILAGIGDLTKLTDLSICECPELEELPILSGLSCLKMIAIDSCQNLQTMILPTTLFKLTVSRYSNSKLLSAIGNLTKLEELSISECPELQELPCFTKLSGLKMIAINSCEKLHTITLLSTVIKLTVKGCIELRRVVIGECPSVDELHVSGRSLSCVKRTITFDSCEMLENIHGVENWKAFEAIQFLYCTNALIQDCMHKFKSVPSGFIQVAGRAADGAKSNLNPSLLSTDYVCHSEIWSSLGAIVICGLVVVNGSDPLHTINESLEDSTLKFNLQQGQWIITTIITHRNYRRLYWQFSFLSQQGIIKKWCAWGVKKKGDDRKLCHALTTIIEKLHQT